MLVVFTMFVIFNQLYANTYKTIIKVILIKKFDVPVGCSSILRYVCTVDGTVPGKYDFPPEIIFHLENKRLRHPSRCNIFGSIDFSI